MKSYSYIARDAKGKEVKGRESAETEQEFLQKMKERGLYLKDYKEDDSENSKSIYKFQMTELAFCCRQLSAILHTGRLVLHAIHHI